MCVRSPAHCPARSRSKPTIAPSSIATGIGFIGAGTVLKLAGEREIRGLTTAASVWVTAAVGVAAGLGLAGAATLGIALAWLVLGVVGRLEARWLARGETDANGSDPPKRSR